MSVCPRPEIEHVPRVVHGGFASAQGVDVLLDFSANVNPSGPSPRVYAAMQPVPLERHPDPRALPLRRFLAEQHGVAVEQVLAGNGSVELIYHLAVAYVRPGDRVLVVEPTFGEYAAAAAVMGAEVCAWRATPATQFAVDVEALLATVQRVRPRLLFLCNPNNPTGSYLGRMEIEALLAGCPDTLLVLDEAFVRFVAAAWPATDLLAAGNLLVLRSLTKDYALTGLRAGYALAPPRVIAALERVQPPWSVNALAQAAAIAALQDEGHLQASLAGLARARDALVYDLTQLCMWPVPSRVHYFLLPVPSAEDWSRQLRERGMLVRDCGSFGLPGHIRIAPRRADENRRLVAALAEIGGRVCRAGC